MSESAKERARREADAKYGDRLSLHQLEVYRKLAFEKGFVRQRKSVRHELADLARAIEPVGDEVYVPLPGQEVGSGARPSRRDPKPFKLLLERTLKERGWNTSLHVADVATRWPDIVGPTVAANCQVESFEGGILNLRAKTTSWETQIRALTVHLQARLDEELGKDVVTEIVIRGPNRPSWKHGRYSVPGRGPRDTYD